MGRWAATKCKFNAVQGREFRLGGAEDAYICPYFDRVDRISVIGLSESGSLRTKKRGLSRDQQAQSDEARCVCLTCICCFDLSGSRRQARRVRLVRQGLRGPCRVAAVAQHRSDVRWRVQRSSLSRTREARRSRAADSHPQLNDDRRERSLGQITPDPSLTQFLALPEPGVNSQRTSMEIVS